jgi:hypothetical protein
MSKITKAGVAFALVVMGACDFDVVNPGPVQDQNLDDTGAHEALVVGAMRGTLNGWSDFAHRGGAISRDHTTGGHVFAGGIPLEEELGQLSDLITAGEGWGRTHQGRWIAEESITRIRKGMGASADSYAPLARLHLWGGFANRVLGENVCTAVIDGGAAQPYKTHFTKAVEHFTQAEKIAAATGQTQVRQAAIAGRASANLYLGKWAEAATDAATLPITYVYSVQYTGRSASDLGNDGEKWRITLAMQSQYRGVSFWHTPFETYFTSTGDPRVAWGHDTRFASAPVPRPTWGKFIPYYYPLKFFAPRAATERTTYAINNNQMDLIPVNLASGKEMLLIRAEAALMQRQAGGVAEAMTLINQVRTSNRSYFNGQPLAPVTATTLEAAWTALKFERLIELTLEGRRFGDRRRWSENQAPGALHEYEYIPVEITSRYSVPKTPNLCFPIPLSEKQANPNVPLDYKDTKTSG